MVSPSATSGGQPKAKAQSAASSNRRSCRLTGASFEQPLGRAHDRQKVAQIEAVERLDGETRDAGDELGDLAIVAVVDFAGVDVENVAQARTAHGDRVESFVAVLDGLAELNSDRAVLMHENAFSDFDVGHGFGLSKRPVNGPEKRRLRRGWQVILRSRRVHARHRGALEWQPGLFSGLATDVTGGW